MAPLLCSSPERAQRFSADIPLLDLSPVKELKSGADRRSAAAADEHNLSDEFASLVLSFPRHASAQAAVGSKSAGNQVRPTSAPGLAHICAGTGPTTAPGRTHICAGTRPHLRRDSPTSAPGRTHICAGTAAATGPHLEWT